ncbi:MAG: helix-turn-helix domain-containing protein [Candidatus Bathyarchaeia archaeon]
MSVSPGVREVLARRIAGEIILSSRPGATMRKWRHLFAVSQMRLSEKMGLSPSVISDYESGRRKSPGTRFVRRFVWALLAIDEERGGRFIREFERLTSSPTTAILDVQEFPLPVQVETFCRAVSGEVVACSDEAKTTICGYTVVDSARAIETFSGWEFFQIFGATTERALIFTNVTQGNSPMVAVRISPLKPRIVVFHGAPPDELAVKLAEQDGIPLVHSKAQSFDHLMKSLRRLYRIMLRRKLGIPVRFPKVRE